MRENSLLEMLKYGYKNWIQFKDLGKIASCKQANFVKERKKFLL